MRHEMAAAYTPQNNQVSERLNRTLLDMERPMIGQEKLHCNYGLRLFLLLQVCGTSLLHMKTLGAHRWKS